MMNQQQEARRAAAQAFMESLEQLQQTLESEKNPPDMAALPDPQTTKAPNASASNDSLSATSFDLSVWAEAIADIDQFIQEKNNDES